MIIWVGRSIASPSFFEKSPPEPGNTAASWPAQEATRGEPRVRGRSAAIADEGGISRGILTERKGEHGQALGLRNLGSGQHPRDRGSFSDPSTFSLTASLLVGVLPPSGAVTRSLSTAAFACLLFLRFWPGSALFS